MGKEKGKNGFGKGEKRVLNGIKNGISPDSRV